MELVPVGVRLDDLCQRLGIGNILKVERPGDCCERREPARERRRRFRRSGAAITATSHGTVVSCVTDDEN
jgi:hypothetical protein